MRRPTEHVGPGKSPPDNASAVGLDQNGRVPTQIVGVGIEPYCLAGMSGPTRHTGQDIGELNVTVVRRQIGAGLDCPPRAVPGFDERLGGVKRTAAVEVAPDGLATSG